MQIEFLGSGGAITTPRPGCQCRLCVEARDKGIPFSRTGPAVFVHGPDVLIDTPEEIKGQLNRARIERVPACLYSHWHPDHVLGRRVWEMNQDWCGWPPKPSNCTDIYLPQQVAADFRTRLGTYEHLEYFQKLGLVRLVEMKDGDAIELNGTRIEPFRLAEDYVYAFLFTEGKKRVLIAPDELFRWSPPDFLRGVDLAILPMGIIEFDPFTGERRIDASHEVLKFEATFDQTLDMVRQMNPKRIIMTHIEEIGDLSHDDLTRLAAKLQAEGLNITFAFDAMRADV